VFPASSLEEDPKGHPLSFCIAYIGLYISSSSSMCVSQRVPHVLGGACRPASTSRKHVDDVMDALEIQNSYISETLTWMANHPGGTFSPPNRHYSVLESSNVATQRTTYVVAHSQVSQDH
jgi:hypothetical protein